MNVNSVNNQNFVPIQFNTPQSSSPAASAASTSSGVTSDLSAVAQFFNQLKQLSAQNPAEFKQVTAQIAQQLTAAAQSSTDPTQAAALNNLASNFTQASQTGQFSSLFAQPASSATQPQGLQPPQSAGGHHHHHHGGGEASSVQSALESIVSNVAPTVQSALNSTTSPTATT